MNVYSKIWQKCRELLCGYIQIRDTNLFQKIHVYFSQTILIFHGFVNLTLTLIKKNPGDPNPREQKAYFLLRYSKKKWLFNMSQIVRLMKYLQLKFIVGNYCKRVIPGILNHTGIHCSKFRYGQQSSCAIAWQHQLHNPPEGFWPTLFPVYTDENT